MGKIATIKSINDEKVLISLEISHNDLRWLEGNIERVHVFSEHNLYHESKIVQRGKRESSKYFLMPKDLRRNLIVNSYVTCNRIETKTKEIFIFAVDKFMENDNRD